jgi:hypothetical protein
MHKSLLVLGVLLVAQSSLGAVEYDFRQTTSSQIEAVPSADFTGHAVIDGDRYRVDFKSGNFANPGVYLISTHAARNQVWVDPVKKQYMEVDAGGVASVLGTTSLTFSNQKVDLVPRDDHPTIAGVATNHYTLNISFDITLHMGALPITQSVTEVIDKWTTTAYGDISESFVLGGALKTNNPALDDLISQETTRIKGFALKQTATITTTSHTVAPNSQLKIPRTVNQQSEFEIISIGPKPAISADLFVIPTGYTKAKPIEADGEAVNRTVTLEPARN